MSGVPSLLAYLISLGDAAFHAGLPHLCNTVQEAVDTIKQLSPQEWTALKKAMKAGDTP